MKHIQIRTEVSGDVVPTAHVRRIAGEMLVDVSKVIPAGVKDAALAVAIPANAKYVSITAGFGQASPGPGSDEGSARLALASGKGDKAERITVDEDHPKCWADGWGERPFTREVGALTVSNMSDRDATLLIQVLT